MRSTIATGSMIASPNTFRVPAVTITVMIANTMKLTGKPEEIADLHRASRRRAKREKSPKLSSSAAK